MATLDEVVRAMKAANASGDVAAARKLAQVVNQAMGGRYTSGSSPQGEVVATTTDGGRVLRAPDGSMSFTSPGYATSDPERIAKIMEGATPADLMQTDLNRERIDRSPTYARGTQVFSGLPFVGSYMDEALSLADPKVGEEYRRTSDAMRAERPGESAALSAAGTVAGIVPAVMAGAPSAAISGARSLGARALLGAGAGAATGAAEGIVYGAGEQEGGGRAENAMKRGLVGAAAGGVIGGAGPYAVEGAKRGWAALRGSDVGTIATQLGVSKPAARVIKNALDAGDIAEAQAALSRAGGNAMLADAGAPARQLLDAAANTGGGAARVVGNAVESRATGASKSMTALLDRTLGKPRGIGSIKDSIRQGSAAARAAAYKDAYDQPINYAGSGGFGPSAAPPARGAMLDDAGVSAQKLLGSAPDAGDDAARLAGTAVERRAPDASRSVVAQGDQQGSALVPSAAADDVYEQGVDYNGDAGLVIEGLLSRVPQSAINEANKLMRVGGHQSRQIMAQVNPDGTVRFVRMPDVRQLDYITRALRSVAEKEDGKGKLGGTTALGRAYGGLATELRSALRQAVPQYGRALDAAADPISRAKGVDFGYALLRDGTSRDDVIRGIHGASKAEKQAMKEGVRSFIDDTLANTKAALTDQNMDAREGIKLVRSLSSRANVQKLKFLIGQKDAEEFFKEMDSLATAFELRAAVSANSKTAIRQSIQGQVRAETAPGILETLASGEPVNATKRFVQLFTGSSDEARALREAGIYEEIAKVLTQTRGPKAQVALKLVQGAMRGTKISESQGAFIGRAVVDAALLAGSHAAGNSISKQ